MNEARRLDWICTPDDEGHTVERTLIDRLRLTPSMVRRAKFRDEGILLDGERVHSDVSVHAGQQLSVVIGDSDDKIARSKVPPAEADASSLPLVTDLIVYEDSDLVICNKPAGVPVHPCPGHQHDTLGNLLAAHFLEHGEQVAFHPVHRLDITTSGLMVVAKSAFVQSHLTDTLHTDGFIRRYLALCEGVPKPRTGIIDAPIGLAGDGARRMVTADGQPARTRYEVSETFEARDENLPGHFSRPIVYSLVQLELETGRTHQIRVHMAHIGCPLLGDDMYRNPLALTGRLSARRPDLIGRPALHSSHLELVHPVTQERLVFDAPLPEDMASIICRAK